ncbi:MAG: hypothetical protein M1827_002079 [Pycnora praestabilis]|nr:MAG: hypothetical protein M1827_002079 [Pycnora praestabilis]
MSVKASTAPYQISKRKAGPSTSAADLEDPHNIDARLSRLGQDILPKSPYLLTIPSDRPFRVSPYQENNWRIGSPFAEHEEQLQYVSFLHRDWDDSILVAKGDWEEKDEVMEKEQVSKNGERSGTSTPVNGQAQKKKISLSAYKSKPKGLVGPAQSIGKGEQNVTNGEEKSSNSFVKEALKPANSKPAPHHGQKRSLEDVSGSHLPTSSTIGDSAPQVKRPRISPPPKSQIAKPNSSAKAVHALPPLLSPTLPASIEDQLMGTKSLTPAPDSNYAHKKTISGTSSSSEAKVPISSGTSTPSIANSAKSALGKRNTEPPSKSLAKPLKKEVPTLSSSQQGVTTETASVTDAKKRPSTMDSKPPTGTPDLGGKSIKVNGVGGASTFFQGLKSGQYASSPAMGATSAVRVEKIETKKRLLVKLKYPKSRKKTIERILNMQPRSKKVIEDGVKDKSNEETRKAVERERDSNGAVGKHRERAREEQNREEDRVRSGLEDEERERERRRNAVKDVSKSAPKDAPKQSEKRARPADDDHSREPPAKRQKAPDNLDLSKNPRTPIPPAFKSPALSNQGSAQKSQISTPKKDIKSVAMRRVDSSDAKVRTPQSVASHGTPTAPSSAEKTNGDGRGAPLISSSGASGDGKMQEIKAWKAENQKFTELGRKLKHEADKLFKPKVEGATVEDGAAKHGAVVAIETVLCYILAFTASDKARLLQRQPGDAQYWRSLLPFWEYVERQTRIYPYLHGLLLQLGAVCRETIHIHDMERLNNDPLPAAAAIEEVPPPTPGTDSNAISSEAEMTSKAATYRKEYITFKNTLVENAHLSQRLWIEGTYQLSIDDLQTFFAQTWAKRSKRLPAKVGENLVPGQYDGAYYLPLGSMSTAVEAVRMGCGLLSEWAKKEGLNWEGRLGI